uniref:Teichoic acid biosynthesis related protein n=1 Tax=Desulfobacca acetoxidans TaxID=60893 RepID=A0A7C3V045_9BACT
MAKILYGVHGTLHGHAMRALTIARHFSEHEFLFVTHDRGSAILSPEYPVVEIPGPLTIYKNHRVATLPTLLHTLRQLPTQGARLRKVQELIDAFQPDVALSDYDYLVAQASRQVGLPCLSVDHQHIITFCRHRLPWRYLPPYWQLALVIKWMFSQASQYLVISFFRPPLKPGIRARLAPPILRESVLRRKPGEGGHVLLYQSISPFPGFFEFLQNLGRPVVVYGFHQDRRDGNLRFKQNSEDGFLDDLASCRYVICAGSHTLTSEALYYGKPVLSIPFQGAFEQVLNVLYLERLGYGRGLTSFPPAPDFIAAFEAHLADYRQAIGQGEFLGNDEAYASVGEFIREKGRVSW